MQTINLRTLEKKMALHEKIPSCVDMREMTPFGLVDYSRMRIDPKNKQTVKAMISQKENKPEHERVVPSTYTLSDTMMTLVSNYNTPESKQAQSLAPHKLRTGHDPKYTMVPNQTTVAASGGNKSKNI